MKPLTLPPAVPAEPAHQPTDGIVISGTFEPALSIKELAAELHVSAQTLYDLRSQGRRTRC